MIDDKCEGRFEATGNGIQNMTYDNPNIFYLSIPRAGMETGHDDHGTNADEFSIREQDEPKKGEAERTGNQLECIFY